MGAGLILFTIFTGITFIVLGIILGNQNKKKNKTQEVEPNQPQITIKAKRILPFTNNYHHGTIVDIITKPNKTLLVLFNPDDVYQGGTEKVRPATQSFIVDENYLIEEKTTSRRRQITILPKDKLDSTTENKEILELSQEARMREIAEVENMNTYEAFNLWLQEQSRLGFTIEKLEKEKQELERLKQQVRDSIQNNQRPQNS